MSSGSNAVLYTAAGAAVGALVAYYALRPSTSDYDALAQAVIRLTACVPGTDAYVQERVAVATLLGQTNTYSTWSLALKGSVRSQRLLYTASATQPDVSPAELGVTASSTPAFLKALDHVGQNRPTWPVTAARAAAGPRLADAGRSFRLQAAWCILWRR